MCAASLPRGGCCGLSFARRPPDVVRCKRRSSVANAGRPLQPPPVVRLASDRVALSRRRASITSQACNALRWKIRSLPTVVSGCSHRHSDICAGGDRCPPRHTDTPSAMEAPTHEAPSAAPLSPTRSSALCMRRAPPAANEASTARSGRHAHCAPHCASLLQACGSESASKRTRTKAQPASQRGRAHLTDSSARGGARKGPAPETARLRR